jgi:hypothetical protein
MDASPVLNFRDIRPLIEANPRSVGRTALRAAHGMVVKPARLSSSRSRATPGRAAFEAKTGLLAVVFDATVVANILGN